MTQQAGTSDYRQLPTQKHGIRAAARWLIKTGRHDQFSLAQEQPAQSKLPLGLDRKAKVKKKKGSRKGKGSREKI